jgi:hypothetical protein
MCDDHPAALGELFQTGSHTRRHILGAAGFVAAGAALLAAQGRPTPAIALDGVDPVTVAPGLTILPRDAWGADLAPRGPLFPEDSRFLLVHHTASPSNYSNARSVIRGTYSFHTSSAKGWPDVCYEFFVGRDGDVWEGRAGSLVGPVVADATGGSQGYAQLVCLLGDFSAVPPTDAALNALTHVLAWLSLRDGIDVAPGATTSFVSRGSNKWKAGTTITTNTIDGHRDMTYTACPGNAMYARLPDLRAAVFELRQSWVAAAVPDRNPAGLRPARRLGRVANP